MSFTCLDRLPRQTPSSKHDRNASLDAKAICGQLVVLSKGGRFMQRQVVRLTRQELYEKMWSRPANSLAEEFGISGRGLGNPVCGEFLILEKIAICHTHP